VLKLARECRRRVDENQNRDRALSEEGQAFLGIDIVRGPVRIGQKQKYMELGRPQTKVITPEFLGQNYERYTKLYHEILGIK